MLRNRTSGFTLIELMVVIVIIGVLASLAIPRFSEASDKAKVAEAPRILASFESAYLAGIAELGGSKVKKDEIIFDTVSLKSKWFTYKFSTVGSDSTDGFVGTTGKIGSKINNGALSTIDTTGGMFIHCFKATATAAAATDLPIGKKYVPNFLGTSLDSKCKY